ncbi:MAG: DNA-3-methyladenine glycosylase [Rhabdochlamydiaceae bacterium]|jgi:3-methyladenine DNA glycosylase Mpg
MTKKLTPDFYQRSDVVQVARELMGKVLFSHIDETVTAGIIVETEAYNGTEDRACHAYRGRKTPRSQVGARPRQKAPTQKAQIKLWLHKHSLYPATTHLLK